MKFNTNGLNIKGSFDKVIKSASSKINLQKPDLNLNFDINGIKPSDMGLSNSDLDGVIQKAGGLETPTPDLNAALTDAFNKIKFNVDPSTYFKKLL